MSLLPWEALEQVAGVITDDSDVHLDAALWHLARHAGGEVLDPGSDLPHLIHAAHECLAALLSPQPPTFAVLEGKDGE